MACTTVIRWEATKFSEAYFKSSRKNLLLGPSAFTWTWVAISISSCIKQIRNLGYSHKHGPHNHQKLYLDPSKWQYKCAEFDGQKMISRSWTCNFMHDYWMRLLKTIMTQSHEKRTLIWREVNFTPRRWWQIYKQTNKKNRGQCFPAKSTKDTRSHATSSYLITYVMG